MDEEMKWLPELSLVGLLAASIVVLANPAAQAEETTQLSDAHINRIKANCVQANYTITQLHASDALLRVNRGQLYDLISTKLMARMNSRLALNRLDASKLVSATAAYDKSLREFRTRYQTYEEQLSATLKIDCKKNPVDYYTAIAKSRELRKAVHESTTALNQYINEYNSEFDSFRQNFSQSGKDNKS